jgi:hypothetical protein
VTLAESLTARYKLIWDDGRVSRGAMERRSIEREPETILSAARAASYVDPDAVDVLGPAPFPAVATYDAATAAIAGGEVSVFAPRLAAIRERVHRTPSARGADRCMRPREPPVSSRPPVWTSRVPARHGMERHVGRRAWCRHRRACARALADVESRLDRLIAFVLGLRTLASVRREGVVPVLLHPDVVEEYVMGVLLHNLDGAQVAHGTGAFRKEQFGATTPCFATT